MGTLLLIASIVLAGVFAVAGVAKLLDQADGRASARAFGVPDRATGLVAAGLALTELVVALLLLFPRYPLVGRDRRTCAARTLLGRRGSRHGPR